MNCIKIFFLNKIVLKYIFNKIVLKYFLNKIVSSLHLNNFTYFIRQHFASNRKL